MIPAPEVLIAGGGGVGVENYVVAAGCFIVVDHITPDRYYHEHYKYCHDVVTILI